MHIIYQDGYKLMVEKHVKILLYPEDAVSPPIRKELEGQHGYILVPAANRDEAIHVIENDTTIDLVLLYCNDHVTIETARSMRVYREIPAIFIIGSENGNILSDIASTANAVLPPQPDPHLLHTTLSLVLKRHSEKEQAREYQVHLEEQRELTEGMMKASSIGFSMAVDRKIVWYNDAMAELFMIGYDDYNGKDTSILYPDDTEYKRVGKILYEDTTAGRPTEIDAIFKRSDGSLFHGLLRINLLHPDDPQKGRIVSIIDITERKNAEEKLKISETRYRELAELLPQAVAEMDMSGNFVFVNESGLKLFGYSYEDLLSGVNVLDILALEDKDTVFNNIQSVILGEPVTGREYTALTKDGRKIPVLIYSSPIIRNETMVGIRSIAIDITDRKEKARLEAQLSNSQKMETLGNLAGGIAHDFNNLLTPILGHADLLKTLVQDDTNLLHHVHGIINASKHARELVKKILVFSRGDDGERKIINLDDIIREVSKLLNPHLGPGIQLDVHNYSRRLHVHADPTRLIQVFMNLGMNAIHSMEERGGTLTITLEDSTIGEKDLYTMHLAESGDYAKIIVQDTGHGIDRGIIDRIFEPFYTNKKDYNGTGLGLSVVHGIVTGYKGTVLVKSKVNEGTSFEVYLPIAEKPLHAETGEKKDDSVSSGNGESILIIDDRQDVLSVITRILEHFNYTITATDNAEEALEYLEKDPGKFHLVITDLTMPYMSGIDLVSRIRANNIHIPVLLMTGHNELKEHGKIDSNDIHEIIYKPLMAEDLVKSVQGAIHSTLDNKKE